MLLLLWRRGSNPLWLESPVCLPPRRTTVNKRLYQESRCGFYPVSFTHHQRVEYFYLSLVCTLASLLSQLVFLRYFVAGTGFEPVTSRLWALQATSALPHNLFVQEAGFAPARFSCLSINLWRGHVCLSLSPLRFELFHHSCVFNLQYVKELSKFGCFELVFIVSKYTVLFPFSDTIFCGPAPYCPAVLLRLLIGSFTGLDQFC